MAITLLPPVLVIGVGNDLRGDDAAGQWVAAVVESWGLPGVRVVRSRQLVPELARDVAAAATVVLVDATVGGSDTPTLTAVTAESAPAALTHHASLAQLLALSEGLSGRRPQAWELPIPADGFDYGAKPSARCRRGIAEAIGLLKGVLPEGGG